jgi:hypothetical protein
VAQIHLSGWWALGVFRQVPLDSSPSQVTFLHVTAWSPGGPDETYSGPTSRVGVSEPFRRSVQVNVLHLRAPTDQT